MITGMGFSHSSEHGGGRSSQTKEGVLSEWMTSSEAIQRLIRLGDGVKYALVAGELRLPDYPIVKIFMCVMSSLKTKNIIFRIFQTSK